MSSNPSTLNLAKIRVAIRHFTWGGDWAIPLPAEVKRNLTLFFFDGLFANASETILVTYLSLYIISLGATKTQIGLMSSFSSFLAAALLVPSALLVERVGHRKEITVIFGGISARIMILALAFLPFFLSGGVLVWVAMALAVAREAFGNMGFPSWMSISADIVPLEGRGRYFGARNFIMGIAGILVTLSVGELITRLGVPVGYQVALFLAFIFGIISTYFFWRLRDPKGNAPTAMPGSSHPWVILREIKKHPIFLSFALVSIIWNFGLNIAGPFFNVYMLNELKFTAAMIGITSVATSITSMSVQRKMGALADRLGPRRVQMVCMFLIPILPFSWMFITELWQVIGLNVLGGIFWGTFNLVSFNFLLSLTPEAQRARYSAIYQMLVTLALAGGAAFGAWLVTQWNYQAVFFASGLVRLTAAVLFAIFVPEIIRPRHENISAA